MFRKLTTANGASGPSLEQSTRSAKLGGGMACIVSYPDLLRVCLYCGVCGIWIPVYGEDGLDLRGTLFIQLIYYCLSCY